MRTFIIRARRGSTRWQQISSQVGAKEHVEVILHSVMNAFFFSNGFRKDVEVYIVLDSSEDFPRTIQLSGQEGLSIAGFHEAAILQLVEKALKDSIGLHKDETQKIAPGLFISGFGFERLVAKLLETRPVYLLDPKGEDITALSLAPDPVFVLSDHLKMPKNSVTSLKRRGLKTISLGKKMLFASQCVVLLHYKMDQVERQ